VTPSPIIREDIQAIASSIAREAPLLDEKTILITGGAGFLGKYFLAVFHHLNRHVLSRPCRVISVDNYITGDRDPSFEFYGNEHILDVWADVCHPLPVRERVDYIIHAAGLASPVYYQQFPLETIDSAVVGTKNLLELARRNPVKGFLFFSSSEIYGDPDPSVIPIPETYCGNVSSIGPRACYDESKRLAETICTIYHQRYDIPTKIVRPFNVFGPGMKHNDRRVVPMFVFKMLNGESLPVHGDGHQTRTFCYISDAIAGFLKALLRGSPGGVYNIGNSENEMPMRDLAALVTSFANRKTGFACVPYPPTYPGGEPQRRCPDIAKARAELGYEPQVSVHEGLERTIAWCRCQPSYTGGEAAPAAARKEPQAILAT